MRTALSNVSPASPPVALVTIHDVMPEYLAKVESILALCQDHDLRPITLLVVPGRPWEPSQIAMLRAWTEAGHILAGHGWQHHVDIVRGLRHRLHSLLISRYVAEHLALDAIGIAELILRCHAFFAEHDLPAPTLYVPPAWAMGRIPRATLRQLPFAYYETLNGVYDAHQDRYHTLPLLGFEADTSTRAAFLTVSNAVNAARGRGRVMRIAIHPHDLDYRLADRLRSWLATPLRCLHYNELAASVRNT